MSDPFPLLFQSLRTHEARAGEPPADDARPHVRQLGRDAVLPLFEASVRGVQSRFPHLSEADIAAPPHCWFDAALARQIALHLLVHEFGQPKRAVAEELARSREAVNRALRTIDERLAHPEFQDSYAAMAESAQDALRDGER